MKITITVEDGIGGKVKVESSPSFAVLASSLEGGLIDSSAAGYALHMLNAARVASKTMVSKGIGALPRPRRLS